MTTVMKAEQAKQAILRGEAPDDLRVEGKLYFYNDTLKRLPVNWQVDSLSITGCGPLRTLPAGLRCASLSMTDSAITHLPPDLQVSEELCLTRCPYLKTLTLGAPVRRLRLRNCKSLVRLPTGAHITEELVIQDCQALAYLPDGLYLRALLLAGTLALSVLPADLQVTQQLAARNSGWLESIPPLAVASLDLAGCSALRDLPDGLRVRYLNITGCVALQRWPRDGLPGLRRLHMSGCAQLESLPPGLWYLEELGIRDCVRLRALPERLRVTRWLDIGGLTFTSEPLSTEGFRLRWRGVPISGRVAFHPETLTVEEALNEPDLEVRRVMIERMGYEKFLQSAQAKTLDQDADPGGERRLLKIDLHSDEPLVCLAVRDPSTGRQYVLRVPPWMRSCHEAAAWIADYNPNRYHPVAET
ncbi:MAG TPA: hypothetical protein VMV29_17185 [Ktedonobacterales bacterium]|nr:hypothetical protein [Ktedonobacterales bacterium]